MERRSRFGARPVLTLDASSRVRHTLHRPATSVVGALARTSDGAILLGSTAARVAIVARLR
jgi:hypothetical protein